MIPAAHITDWRRKAPWSTDAQVEQDLVLCRAQFEQHMSDRMTDKKFTQDPAPLLVAPDAYDPVAAYQRVHDALIARLSGDPWRGLP